VTPLTLVLYILTVARLTHLVVVDDLLDGPRRWVGAHAWVQPTADTRGHRSRGWPVLNAIITCPWCASPYIAGFVLAALALGLPDWCLYIPAASYVTGWLEMALGAMDDG